jgi:hypothetical protein
MTRTLRYALQILLASILFVGSLPSSARFLGVDPIHFQENNIHSFNRYAYGNNNPYRFIDPDGRAPHDILKEGRYGGTAGMSGLDRMMQIRANESLIREMGPRQSLDPAIRAQGKSFQTYTKTNAETGEVYSGRTSGVRSPEGNVQARDSSHHMNEQGFGPARLDRSSSNSSAIRGREQQLIEEFGGARSTGGTSGNAINGISPANANRSTYINEAVKEFGTP